MKDLNMVFAGFGGQGVLFAGKVAAYAGLLAGKEISWLPSYGPEMRGGTANCSVCVSDQPIGSPLVTNPNVLVAMNLPSLDRFIDGVEPGGTVLVDSSLINKKVERTDLRALFHKNFFPNHHQFLSVHRYVTNSIYQILNDNLDILNKTFSYYLDSADYSPYLNATSIL